MLDFEKVTVNEAMNTAQKRVRLPSWIIFLVSLLAAIGIGFFTHNAIYIPFILITGAALAILYHSIAVSKWQLWAFANVRNVHDLKRRAITEGFFKDDGHSNITQFKSSAYKAQWKTLEQKFKQADLFVDEPQIPAETIIRYSKTKKLVWLFFLWIPMCVLGVYLLFNGGHNIIFYLFPALIISVGAGAAYVFVRDAFDQTPQIIINNEGLGTAQTRFVPWQDISDAKTIRSGSGKSTSIYLTYHIPTGNVRFGIDDFTVSRSQLDHLLSVYYGRYVHRQNALNKQGNL